MDGESTPKDGHEEVPYDLFIYPRLYPSGWDLSELAKEPPADPNAEDTAEPMPKMSDLFLEPRLYPPGWDLS